MIRYYFDDHIVDPGTYRYFVVAYDIESGEEGRASLAKTESWQKSVLSAQGT